MPSSVSDQYLYGLDDHPPWGLTLLYALQWAVIIFPAYIVTAKIAAQALHLSGTEEARFLQITLVCSGLGTLVQTLWGHRYPLVEGPATAHLLTFVSLSPLGVEAIQGASLAAAGCLALAAATGAMKFVVRLFTPNVVGVILMLIAFSLLPHLIPCLLGLDAQHVEPSVIVLAVSLALVVLMAILGQHLKGIWRTCNLALGLLVGTLLFTFLDRVTWNVVSTASWVSLPRPWVGFSPRWHVDAFAAFLLTYLAIAVNSIGSLQSMEAVTVSSRTPSATPRGLAVNGLCGMVCSFFGVVGTVSYSTGPGVVLASRVASCFPLAWCGILVAVAAFVPKLVAILSLVPSAVVAAALCVAMAGQVGAGLAVVGAGKTLAARDYFVVGIPVLLGTLLAFLPSSFIVTMSGTVRIFLGNGLVFGIIVVLLLEHVVFAEKSKE
ncbi:MAG: uracil-xanthine permease family protein [Desulfosoma sp.]|uniref:uracil-xanthine permease family protein n=1 Tax=Desulfosoma sp. TaxID=2603217 RepID=UPI004049C241